MEAMRDPRDDPIGAYFDRLGKAFRLALARRDEREMNRFRDDAMTKLGGADGWFRLLSYCDKYRSDLARKGRI